MLFYVIKMPGIDAIFKRDKSGNYTKKALLYQDVLRYSLEKKGQSENTNSFRHWQLAKWLMSYNEEFINHYKDPSSRHITFPNRIENTQRSTKNKLNDLIDLQLIRITGSAKAEKGTGVVSLYSFTDLGYLLAWIIESNKPQKHMSAIDEIYKIIQLLLTINEDSPSAIIFYSYFFRKCRDRGVFDKLVQHIWHIAHANLDITNMQDLFERVADLGFEDQDIRRMFFDLWHESLEELEANQKALVLYQMKLDAERRFQNKKEYFTKEYEEKRFQYRDNYEYIVVEGSCQNCGTGPLALSYLEYRKGFANVARNDSIKLDCPICDSKDNLVISNF
jgi:hypothetical protein